MPADSRAPSARFTHADYHADAVTLARRLIGQRLVRVTDRGERLSGLIVETEAYLGTADRACHSFAGRRTPRVEPMYARAGTAYVYFTYGMHHCFNVVAGEIDEPVAVLIRALRPLEGLATMTRNRGSSARGPHPERDLCSGPARLCQALAIDRRHSALDLVTAPNLFIERARPDSSPPPTATSARIGVGYAGAWARRKLRFFLRGDPNVSR